MSSWATRTRRGKQLRGPCRQGAAATGRPLGGPLELLTEDLLHAMLKHLDDYSDCARFSRASPRLGLGALRQKELLPRFQHPLFAVAMRMEGGRHMVAQRSAAVGARALLPPDTGAAFAEAWLRKYARDRLASPNDFAWIRVASAELYIAEWPVRSSTSSFGQETWTLRRSGEMDAKQRLISPSRTMQH